MPQDATTMTGVVSGGSIMNRDTYQQITSRMKVLDAYSKSVRWACFQKTPALQAFGVEAYGAAPMQDVTKFGAAKPSGRIIRMDSGFYGISGSVFATKPTGFHTGRMGSFTPQLVEGGDEYAYSWHQLNFVEYIPVRDVQNNTQGYINIKAQKMEGMKQAMAEGFNYAILGDSTNMPDAGAMGPYVVHNDLTHLISMTLDATVTPGNLSKANAYWKNGIKAITSIGGGGEMDRPLPLRRSIRSAMLARRAMAEANGDYLFLVTQGAYQYVDRLMYADTIQSGNSGAYGQLASYDAVGIEHLVLFKKPMVYDPAVQVPVGATASTEAIYGIHVPSFFIGLRTEENFTATDWETPREHDQYKTLVARLSVQYTPGVTAMRPHFVCYNLPACAD